MVNEATSKTATGGALERRNLIKSLGLGVAGAAALSAAGAGGMIAASTPARAATLTDADIFNFALNLEYLEAEYYLRAVTGTGLPSSLTSGTGTQGTVTGGSLVPFKTPAVAYYAQRIANDELAHVRFIRDVLGSSAVAEPNIDLSASFTTLAIAAGLIVQGQTFNPFGSELDFVLGAYIFEDVGVTAYAGAAGALTNSANISYAASILAAEGYHAGAIRGLLSDIGAGQATDAISALRANLSGVTDYGTDAEGNPFNIANLDYNGQAFRRTPGQVLSIVYAGSGKTGGLFYPNGVNGTITASSSSASA